MHQAKPQQIAVKGRILAVHEKRKPVLNGDCRSHFRLFSFAFQPDYGFSIYTLPETVRFGYVRPQAPRPKDCPSRTNLCQPLLIQVATVFQKPDTASAHNENLSILSKRVFRHKSRKSYEDQIRSEAERLFLFKHGRTVNWAERIVVARFL